MQAATCPQFSNAGGKRVGADVVKGKEGADPGAVSFEATKKANELLALPQLGSSVLKRIATWYQP